MSSPFQNRFPRIWLLGQLLIGATFDKRKLAVRHYTDEKNVLEVGCSVGNITPVFFRYPGISYLGIDIDSQAIAIAGKRLTRYSNFHFRDVSLEKLAQEGKKFDYILFAGMLHHVDDATAHMLLQNAFTLLTPGGKLIISEPEASRKNDNLLFRLYSKLEQGQFLRPKEQLLGLLQPLRMPIASQEDILLAPGIISWPKVIRFNLVVIKGA